MRRSEEQRLCDALARLLAGSVRRARTHGRAATRAVAPSPARTRGTRRLKYSSREPPWRSRLTTLPSGREYSTQSATVARGRPVTRFITAPMNLSNIPMRAQVRSSAWSAARHPPAAKRSRLRRARRGRKGGKNPRPKHARAVTYRSMVQQDGGLLLVVVVRVHRHGGRDRRVDAAGPLPVPALLDASLRPYAFDSEDTASDAVAREAPGSPRATRGGLRRFGRAARRTPGTSRGRHRGTSTTSMPRSRSSQFTRNCMRAGSVYDHRAPALAAELRRTSGDLGEVIHLHGAGLLPARLLETPTSGPAAAPRPRRAWPPLGPLRPRPRRPRVAVEHGGLAGARLHAQRASMNGSSTSSIGVRLR